MQAPLYEALIAYSESKYPFHMPGHKLGRFGDMAQLPLLKLDVTEANGLDNLYEAEGIIAEAMKEMSRFYGAKESILLTNGSTAGILASILAICKPGDKLLVARNCHHSVWHGLILSGAIPIYMTPEYDASTGLMTKLSVDEVQKQLSLHPDVKGALIVSPTYEGVVSHIDAIAKCLHAQNKLLIVDEAHGAHFGISDYFPRSSLTKGADIVIHSMHKTLPTLTQSALLHIGTHRVEKAHLIKCLRMVQTSSPSYTMMGLMDYTRAYIETHIKEITREYIEPLKTCRENLSHMHVLQLLQPLADYDYGKIIIFTHEAAINGYQLAEELEVVYGLVVEAALPESIIVMTTLADDQGSLIRLTKALMTIDSILKHDKQKADKSNSAIIGNTIRTLASSITYSPRDVYYTDTQCIYFEQCEGLVSKENIMLYPPGIPLVCIGEVFTKEHLHMIDLWGEKLKGIIKKDGKYYCQVSNQL